MLHHGNCTCRTIIFQIIIIHIVCIQSARMQHDRCRGGADHGKRIIRIGLIRKPVCKTAVAFGGLFCIRQICIVFRFNLRIQLHGTFTCAVESRTIELSAEKRASPFTFGTTVQTRILLYGYDRFFFLRIVYFILTAVRILSASGRHKHKNKTQNKTNCLFQHYSPPKTRTSISKLLYLFISY